MSALLTVERRGPKADTTAVSAETTLMFSE